ncbi:MAG: 4-(cytidine 5'-diphospho)-2-C-methyl-D-erythritol kinase [Nitrospinae bacterium]|nr:4-(cytidine 5'-diphospho)-2-C-methyl-D-erythritol kinase [Nitrospinota bacterium]
MRPKPLTVESPAKVNLLLKITGIRKDGYHTIASLFQMVELCDRITFSPAPSGTVRVTCSGQAIRQKDNLAYNAAMALWRPGLPGVRIHIEKKIPSGAGLGGGSSNAATVLSVLNRLWGLGLSPAALRAKGARLGADVPFFLFGPRAWVTGIGDGLLPLPPAERFCLLLVKPRVKVPTVKAYRDFDAQLTHPLKSYKIPAVFRKEGVLLDDAAGFLENDLEKTVLGAFPVVATIKRKLIDLGAKGVMLTGSGSAVFALFKSPRLAFAARRKLSKQPWWCEVTLPRESMKHLDIAGRLEWRSRK